MRTDVAVIIDYVNRLKLKKKQKLIYDQKFVSLKYISIMKSELPISYVRDLKLNQGL